MRSVKELASTGGRLGRCVSSGPGADWGNVSLFESGRRVKP